MPKKYVPFQEHTSDRIFAKVHVKTVRSIAVKENKLSSDTRLFLVGLGRLSNKGHAPFAKGELSLLLGTEDRNLRKIIRKLVLSRLLSPESSVRCLVYPLAVLTQSTYRGSDSCPEHGTHRSWSTQLNDWVDDYLPVVSEVTESVEIIEVSQVQNGPFEEFESQYMGTVSA